MNETPWSDCKVAYGYDGDVDHLWKVLHEDPEGTNLLPENWTFVETDCGGARCVAVFRVEGVPTIEDGREVERVLADIASPPRPKFRPRPPVQSYNEARGLEPGQSMADVMKEGRSWG